MSETPQEPQQPAEGEGAAQGQPAMRLLTQYLKDLSFESPAAPQSLDRNASAPNMEVSVDLNARALGENRYEVELSCSATARRDGQVIFLCEANYAGLFIIENIPAERIEPVLLVDAPHLLFPFVRQIIAQSTRDGGFMPLLLEPLDFFSMYQQQRAKRAQEMGEVSTGPAGGDAGPAAN